MLRVIDWLFRPLPEITHMHRQPERRTPALVSLVFVAVVAAPVALYLLVVGPLCGANLGAFPTGAAALPALAFHAGLAAIMGLYLLFWTSLNLLQTVPLLAVLASATAVFGSTTLGHLSKAAVAPVAGARGSASASLVKQD